MSVELYLEHKVKGQFLCAKSQPGQLKKSQLSLPFVDLRFITGGYFSREVYQKYFDKPWYCQSITRKNGIVCRGSTKNLCTDWGVYKKFSMYEGGSANFFQILCNFDLPPTEFRILNLGQPEEAIYKGFSNRIPFSCKKQYLIMRMKLPAFSHTTRIIITVICWGFGRLIWLPVPIRVSHLKQKCNLTSAWAHLPISWPSGWVQPTWPLTLIHVTFVQRSCFIFRN